MSGPIITGYGQQCWCATSTKNDDVPHPHDTQWGCPVLAVPPPKWANPAPTITLDQPQRTFVNDGERYTADVYRGGGKREENGDRPRFDLLWTESQPLERQMLTRDAVWYQKGAAKYGERNWEKFDGQAELVRAQASLGRHYAAFMLGLTDEDHGAAIRANVQFIEYIRERLAEPDPESNAVPCGNAEGCSLRGGTAHCAGCKE